MDLLVFSSDDEELVEPVIKVPIPIHAEHLKLIAKRRIDQAAENPFGEVDAQIMRKNFPMIEKIMYKAADILKIDPDDIDAEWYAQTVTDFWRDKDLREQMLICRNHILPLAKYAATSAELEMINNKNYSKVMRRIRLSDIKVDTFQNKEPGRKAVNEDRKRRVEKEKLQEESEEEEDPLIRSNKLSKKGNSRNSQKAKTSITAAASDDEQVAAAPFEPIEEGQQFDNVAIKTEASTSKCTVPERRQQLRQQFSSHIDRLKPLGREMADKPEQVIPIELDGDDEQEQTDQGRQPTQRKKRTPAASSRAVNNRMRTPVGGTSNVRRIAPNDQSLPAESDEQTDGIGADTSMDAELPSSSSGTIPNRNHPSLLLVPTKSCLKTCGTAKPKRKVFFSADSLGRDVEPLQKTKSLPGQTTTVFTKNMRPPQNNKGQMMLLPNYDHKIQLAVRENPELKKYRLKDINSELRKDLYNLFRPKQIRGDRNRRSTHLVIADTMLEPLDESIYKNLSLLRLNFPRLPTFLVKQFEEWLSDELSYERGGAFLYSKVFFVLGLDLIFYYAHPKGEEIEALAGAICSLLSWFAKATSKTARCKTFEEALQRNLAIELKKPREDLRGEVCYIDVCLYRVPIIPAFVIVTIPEIGGWDRFLRELNNRLRKLVEQNPVHFELLDWAKVVNETPAKETDSVEKRTAMLVKMMHEEHGVLYD